MGREVMKKYTVVVNVPEQHRPWIAHVQATNSAEAMVAGVGHAVARFAGRANPASIQPVVAFYGHQDPICWGNTP